MDKEQLEVVHTLFKATRKRIDAGGWTVMVSRVQGPETNEVDVSIAYTVGLMAKGLPELLVYGLPGETGHGILNDAAARLIAGDLEKDVPVDKLSNFPLVFKQVDPQKIEEVFGVVRLFSPDGKSANLLQCVWPDKAGLFPWEAGFNEAFRKDQPLHFDTEKPAVTLATEGKL